MGFIDFREEQARTRPQVETWGTGASDMFGVSQYITNSSEAEALIKLLDVAKGVYATKLDSDKEVRKLIDKIRLTGDSKMNKKVFLERIGEIYSRLAMDIMENAVVNQDKSTIDSVARELTNRFEPANFGGSDFVNLEDQTDLKTVVSEFVLFALDNNANIPTKYSKFKSLWDMFKVRDERYLIIEPTTVFDSMKRRVKN